MAVLIVGFAGAGKITLSRFAAEELGWNAIDMDDLITERTGSSIPEIFTDKGEDGFRLVEKEVLSSLIHLKDAVIATGGGTPCFHGNMSRMNEHGLTIYLKVPVNVLFSRLKNDYLQRPLLENVPPHDLENFIINNLKSREPFYQQAQFVYDPEMTSFRKLIDWIRQHHH